MKERIEIPQYFQSTIEMLDKTYPEDILDADYYPLLKILKNSGMSDRSVAHAIAVYKGGKYIDFLYEVAHIMPNKKISEKEIERVINKLIPNGYENWLNEE